MLNPVAIGFFSRFQVFSSTGVKSHRPVPLGLNTTELDQKADVAQHPRAFPVDAMLPMEEADEEILGERVLQVHRENIEPQYVRQVVDIVAIYPILNQVVKDYLERRTRGTGGKPGKKGRGLEPKLESS